MIRLEREKKERAERAKNRHLSCTAKWKRRTASLEEALGKAVGPSGQAIAGQLTFQSSLTAPLVEQILATGHCDLPSLSNSAAQHRPLLNALLQHWNHSQSREDLAVPIT